MRRQGKDLESSTKEEKTTQLCYILERVRNKDRRDTVYNFPDLVAFCHSLFLFCFIPGYYHNRGIFSLDKTNLSICFMHFTVCTTRKWHLLYFTLGQDSGFNERALHKRDKSWSRVRILNSATLENLGFNARVRQ